jgi:predicted transcriptional regulator YdeE
LMEGYRLPPVTFTEREANALITAEQLVRTNKDDSFVKEYTEAVNKIRAVLRLPLKDKVELLADRTVFRHNQAQLRTSNYLATLQLALTNFNVVMIEYLALNTDQLTQRHLEPFALYSTQDNWLLVAWCRLRADFRTFRLDQIQKLVVSQDTFPPHALSLPAYFEACRKKQFATPDIGLSKPTASFGLSPIQPNKMSYQSMPAFNVIGIAVRTTNENGQAGRDIPALWQQWMAGGLAAQIPNKVGELVYCIYTDYEKDHTLPYTTILGCQVSSLASIPEGMVGQTIGEGHYAKHVAQGNIFAGMVFGEWTKIWASDLPRAFTADFEVYGPKASNPAQAEVDIFVAVK